MPDNEVTFTTEQDGAVSMKDTEGNTIRYVKETDLLSIKGSRDDLQKKLEAAESAKNTATSEADKKADTALQQQLQAEAKVESLTENIKKHTGTAEELTGLKAKLETAQEAEKSSSTELLELRRAFIVSTYKVPPDTVKDKDLSALKVFEEALKAVVGAAGGNYAFGGGGGGAKVLEGKSPMELAQMAYAEKK